MASACDRVTTAESAVASASFTAFTLPKCWTKRCVVRAPTPGTFHQFARAVAHLAALAVVGDGEAMGFVADHLDEVQDGRAAVQHDRGRLPARRGR